MAGEEATRSLIERCQAAVRQHREEQETWLAMLDFDWRNVPRLEHGEIDANPLNAPQSLDIELRDGRLITLRELYQYYVYQGTLCGVPPTPENELVEALKDAQRVFPQFGKRPVMLRPVFHGGTFKRRPGEKPYPYPLVWLPKVCTIAQFESSSPARAGSDPFSSLVVVWFQDAYGIPEDLETLQQLSRVDWASNAVDWSP